MTCAASNAKWLQNHNAAPDSTSECSTAWYWKHECASECASERVGTHHTPPGWASCCRGLSTGRLPSHPGRYPWTPPAEHPSLCLLRAVTRRPPATARSELPHLLLGGESWVGPGGVLPALQLGGMGLRGVGWGWVRFGGVESGVTGWDGGGVGRGAGEVRRGGVGRDGVRRRRGVGT